MKKNIPKSDVFYFRLTSDQKEKLSELSAFYHCNNAKFLRLMVDAWYDLHNKLVKKHVDNAPE